MNSDKLNKLRDEMALKYTHEDTFCHGFDACREILEPKLKRAVEVLKKIYIESAAIEKNYVDGKYKELPTGVSLIWIDADKALKEIGEI